MNKLNEMITEMIVKVVGDWFNIITPLAVQLAIVNGLLLHFGLVVNKNILIPAFLVIMALRKLWVINRENDNTSIQECN